MVELEYGYAQLDDFMLGGHQPRDTLQPNLEEGRDHDDRKDEHTKRLQSTTHGQSGITGPSHFDITTHRLLPTG
jgi:hypothetical protein